MTESNKLNMEPSFNDTEDEDVDIFMSLMGIERCDGGDSMHINGATSLAGDNDGQQVYPLQVDAGQVAGASSLECASSKRHHREGKKVAPKTARIPKVKVVRKDCYNGVVLPSGNDAASRFQRRRIRNKLSAKFFRQRTKDTLDGVKRDVVERNAKIMELRKKFQQLQTETSSLEATISSVKNNVDMETFREIIEYCKNRQCNESTSNIASVASPGPLQDSQRSHIIPDSPLPVVPTDSVSGDASVVIEFGRNGANRRRGHQCANTVVSTSTNGRQQNTQSTRLPPKRSAFNFGTGGLV